MKPPQKNLGRGLSLLLARQGSSHPGSFGATTSPSFFDFQDLLPPKTLRTIACQILSILCAIVLEAQIGDAQTIGPDVLVNNGSVSNVAQPQVAAFEDTVVAVNSLGGHPTYFSYSTNAGFTWANGGRLSGQKAPCDFPSEEASICADNRGKFYAISIDGRCPYGWNTVAVFIGSFVVTIVIFSMALFVREY